MPHCFGSSPNCHDCIFQLKLGASELLTPIFEFILFVRIDSVISERPSFGSESRHGISPCQSVTNIFGLLEKTDHNGYSPADGLYQIAGRKDTGRERFPGADAPILSQTIDYSSINISSNCSLSSSISACV